MFLGVFSNLNDSMFPYFVVFEKTQGLLLFQPCLYGPNPMLQALDYFLQVRRDFFFSWLIIWVQVLNYFFFLGFFFFLLLSFKEHWRIATTRGRLHAPRGMKLSGTCLLCPSDIIRIKWTTRFGIKINIPLFSNFLLLLLHDAGTSSDQL